MHTKPPGARLNSSGCCGRPTHLPAQLQVTGAQVIVHDMIARRMGTAHLYICQGPGHAAFLRADDVLKSRDSSIKRNNALLKRLRAVSEDTKQTVVDDIQKVNQIRVSWCHKCRSACRKFSWHYNLNCFVPACST